MLFTHDGIKLLSKQQKKVVILFHLIFSLLSLDVVLIPNEFGYAMVEEVVAYWQSMGVEESYGQSLEKIISEVQIKIL